MTIKHVAIITDDPGWHGLALKNAFAQRNVISCNVSLLACHFTLCEVGLPLFLPGFTQQLPDAVFVRGVPGGSLEQVVFYLDVLHALSILGVPVYNPARAIEKSVDKGLASFMLQQAGLPTPATWVVNERSQALAIVSKELAEGKMVMSKPLFGSQGEGIHRLEKSSDLLWLSGTRGIFYLQRFVACNGAGFSDYRVFVINGKAVAAMVRRGHSWLNNVARGAYCERSELVPELVTLAVKATQALQMDYAGVDIIQDQTGCYQIIEINSIPAWKGLQSVCDVNIAQLLVDDLLSRYLSMSIGHA